MITVHHLNNSRSQRILWLMEELGEPYEIIHYTRHPETQMAPPEMKALHPLGSGPLISDKGQIFAESGAIIEYILRHYGKGRLQPAPESADYDRYIQWMHYAEGSAMTPLLMVLYARYHDVAESTLMSSSMRDTKRHLGYINAALAGRDFVVGDSITGADMQMTFICEAAAAIASVNNYPNIVRYVNGMHARPAYRRSLEKGGAYEYERQFPKSAQA
jgi:glutathione S-transferase